MKRLMMLRRRCGFDFNFISFRDYFQCFGLVLSLYVLLSVVLEFIAESFVKSDIAMNFELSNLFAFNLFQKLCTLAQTKLDENDMTSIYYSSALTDALKCKLNAPKAGDTIKV